MTDLVLSVQDALARLTTPDAALGVAVSGGGDSLALLAIATIWSRNIRAATVDHGLRPESRAEAEFVAAFCAERGISHDILTLGPLTTTGNLSAVVRQARLEALAHWANRHAITDILLGHTMDDQAETLLMRLARRSGIEGLSAMAACRVWSGIRWLRPLLDVRRKALRTWLSEEAIAWIDDPTNDDPGFDRVKARRALDLLEPLGIDVEGLAGTASTLQRQREVWDRAVDDLAATGLTWDGLGGARISRASLGAAPHDTASSLVGAIIRQIGDQPYPPRFRSLSALVHTLIAPGMFATGTLGGCLFFAIDEAYALICREPAGAGAAPRVRQGELWDGRWEVKAACGDKALWVGAVGESGLKALKAAERAGTWTPSQTWRTAPRLQRLSVPGLWTEDSALVAVPSAGWGTRVIVPASATHLPDTSSIRSAIWKDQPG